MSSCDGGQKAKSAWLRGADHVYAHRLAHHKQDAIFAADLYARSVVQYHAHYTPQDAMPSSTSWLWRCVSMPPHPNPEVIDRVSEAGQTQALPVLSISAEI